MSVSGKHVTRPGLQARLAVMLEAIKFEHTVFALPFVYLGLLLAAYSQGPGLPTWERVLWATVAAAGARTMAMAANRIIDCRIDGANPRTASRALPRGLLSVRDMALLGTTGMVTMFIAAWQLNELALRLAPVAAIVLVVYPYTKRVTWLSHAVLGLADGAAPLGGWIAVTGSVSSPAIVLALAVALWVGGFDLIYACMDVDFDRRTGLRSIPARFGIGTALRLSSLAHVLTVACLGVAGYQLQLAPLFWVGLALAAGLLIYEHAIVHPHDLSRLNVAFFNVNGYVALIVLAFTMGALYVRV